MKKHLIRILTVLCMVCLGAALFAGCKPEEEKPGPDDATTTYTVTYDANGGKGTAPATQKYEEGATFKVAQNPFTKDGETFKAWNDGSRDYAPGADYTMPKKNVTFKAQWTKSTEPPKEQVTVTFSLGEYTEGNTPAAQKVNKGEEYTLPAAPAWAGHYCTGWKVGSGDVKKVGEKITPDADVTLTAQWKEVSHAITGVTLEKTTDTMYLVVSGTYTGYTEDEMVDALENGDKNVLKISLCTTADWTYPALDTEADAKDGTWTFKFDVTDLENGIYYPCENQSGSGDIAWNDAYAKTDDLGGHTFEVKKRVEETGGPFIMLTIIDTPDPTKTYAITAATIEEKNGKPIVTISGTYEGYEANEFKGLLEDEDTNVLAFHIFLAGGTDGHTWTHQDITPTYTVADGNFSVEFDVSSLADANYQIGENHGSYGDIHSVTCNVNVTVAGKKYTLNGSASCLVLSVITDTGEEYAITGATVETESNKAYFVVSGTYAGYEEAKLKTLLENTDSTNTTAINFNFYAAKGGTSNHDAPRTATVSGGTWTLKIDVTDMVIGGYTLCWKNDGHGDVDLSAEQAANKSVDCGDKTYALVNKDSTYWGHVALVISAKTTPEPPAGLTWSEPTSVTLEVIKSDGREEGKLFRTEVDAAFLVLKGTYTGEATEANAQEYFSQAKYSFKFTAKEWKDRLRRISIDTSAKTWTVKFDVTSLPVGDNKCVLKDADLKLTVGADATKTVKSLGSTFTLTNLEGGVLAVNVKHNYAITGIDLEKEENGTPRLVMKGTYEANVWTGEDIKKFLLDDDVRTLCLNLNNYIWPMNDYYSADVTASDGNFTVKLDISRLSARTDDLVLSEGSGYGTITMTGISKEISTDIKKYTLKTGADNKVVLTVALLVEQTWTVTDANVAAEGDKVYITVNGTHSGYTVDEFKALLEDSNHNDLAFRVFLFGGNWATQDTPPVYTVAAGTFSVKFDITSLPNGTFGIGKDWSDAGDIKTTSGTSTAKLAGKVYTLTGTAGNLTVEIKTDGTVTLMGIDIAVDAGKVYLTITGTFTGYSDEEVKALLEGEIDQHKYFSFWGNTVKRENPTSIVVTVEGSGWTAKCDVTDLQVESLRNIGCPGDTKATQFSNGVTDKSVILGNKKYTLQAQNGSGWDNVGLKVETVTFTPTELKLEMSEDGTKAYVVLTATSAGYTQEELATLLYVDGDKSIAAASATLAEGVATVKFDFTNAQVAWWWPHYKFGADGQQVDIRVQVKQQSVCVNGKQIVLFYHSENAMPSIEVLEASLAFLNAKFVQESDKLYLVLTAYNAANYTEAELKTLTYIGELETMKLTDPSVTIEGKNVTFKFDVSTLTNNGKWWWGHYTINGGDQVDLKGGFESGEVTFNGKKYSLFNNNGPQIIFDVKNA